MASNFQVVVITPQRTLDLTAAVASADWTTNALGGYGSANFALLGEPSDWIPRTPKLSLIRITQDETVLFEGQIEDHEYSRSADEVTTTVQCFGLARLLTEQSVHTIWSKRDMDWQPRPATEGSPDAALTGQVGRFEPSDLTKVGIFVVGNGGTTTAGRGTGFVYKPPSGITLNRFMFTYDKAGSANLHAQVWSRVDAGGYSNHLDATANVTGSAQDFALVSGCNDVLVQSLGAIAFATAVSDFMKLYNARVLGTTLTEDATGGFYGGTILRDLITLVPGLSAGSIDTGSEFTIEAIERATRAAAVEVVAEVAGYYDKEWGVYENGRLDWKSADVDSQHWIIDVADLSSLSLRSSVDEISSREFVLYTDAATGLEMEASASSTSRGNPYVVRSRNRDLLTSPGFPMTTNTSAQLASRLIRARGEQPFASGGCSLSYRTSVGRGDGGALPAFRIRAGENIKITGLPKTDPYNAGRDGETLFHIVSTQMTLDGSVQLTLDSQEHAIDALLARLAAVTRTLTG